jgi:hypothetical protein
MSKEWEDLKARLTEESARERHEAVEFVKHVTGAEIAAGRELCVLWGDPTPFDLLSDRARAHVIGVWRKAHRAYEEVQRAKRDGE